jgi:hypothetical protein
MQQMSALSSLKRRQHSYPGTVLCLLAATYLLLVVGGAIVAWNGLADLLVSN